MNRFEEYLYENFKNFKVQFIGDAWWKCETTADNFWGDDKINLDHPKIVPYRTLECEDKIYYHDYEIKGNADFAHFLREGRSITNNGPRRKRDLDRLVEMCTTNNRRPVMFNMDVIKRDAPGIYYAEQKNGKKVPCTFNDYILCDKLVYKGLIAVGAEGYAKLAALSDKLPIATKTGHITKKSGNQIIFGMAEINDYNNRNMTFLKKNIKTNKYVLTSMTLNRIDEPRINKKGEEYRAVYDQETGTHVTCDLDKGMTWYQTKGKNKAASKLNNNSYGAANVSRPSYINMLIDIVYNNRKDAGFYVDRDYALEHMVRFPNLTEATWEQVKICKLRTKMPVNISDGEAMKMLGITKGLREYPWALCYELLKLKFDQNSIIRICQSLSLDKDSIRRTAHLSYNGIQHVAKALREMKKQNWTIKQITNRIEIDAGYNGEYSYRQINALFYAIRDIGKMLIACHKEGIPCVINQNNFAAIHENCVRLTGRLSSQPNVEIKYSKRDRELERVIDGYRFFLPIDTHTIIAIGEIMHHCVGSYADKAAARSTTIVACLNPEGRLVNCVEVIGKTMTQAKCRHDHKPLGELLDVLKKYGEECDLKCENCYDLDGNDYHMLKSRESHLKEHEDYIITENKIKVLALNNPIGREIYTGGIWQYDFELNNAIGY